MNNSMWLHMFMCKLTITKKAAFCVQLATTGCRQNASLPSNPDVFVTFAPELLQAQKYVSGPASGSAHCDLQGLKPASLTGSRALRAFFRKEEIKQRKVTHMMVSNAKQ